MKEKYIRATTDKNSSTWWISFLGKKKTFSEYIEKNEFEYKLRPARCGLKGWDFRFTRSLIEKFWPMKMQENYYVHFSVVPVKQK